MAKVKLDPIFVGLSGKMGNTVFRTSKKGETIVCKKPDMTRVKWSPAQQAQRERLKRANAYAKAALADPDVRAIYEEMAEQKGKGAYAAARDDYFQGNDLLSKK